jgi:anhydro-N-acetylmuramic acid kinase
MNTSNNIVVVGVMSGTSLDGLDLAFCSFSNENISECNILHAVTIAYSSEMKNSLSNAHLLNAREFSLLHNHFGSFIGQQIALFSEKFHCTPDLVASHGHTVMHEPHNNLTVQIGNGAFIAKECSITTVCDFRAQDVALGGQGAPLVPFGDLHLFNSYDAALNLGGFSNITLMNSSNVVAFDICPVNIVLNQLAQKAGFEYDTDGQLAAGGQIIYDFLSVLESAEHYKQSSPPSLSREWVEKHVNPHLEDFSEWSINDLIRTFVEHVALRIANVLNSSACNDCFLTGGGAFNSFLVERIKANTSTRIIIPEKKLVEFKEALVFAFLGLMRYRKEVNVLSSITGATKDSISGVIWEI